LEEWISALSLPSQKILKLVSNLKELVDVEEEDVTELGLSKITERKLRRALIKLGNTAVRPRALVEQAVEVGDEGAGNETTSREEGLVLLRTPSIDEWLKQFDLSDEESALVKIKLADFVKTSEDFVDLTETDLAELDAYVDLMSGVVRSKRNKIKKGFRFRPASGTDALKMHITYSREDAELLARIQDAAQKAKWEISGVMSNQGAAWFQAWEAQMKRARGVCVFFTQGNPIALNNQGIGYKEKFAARVQKQGEGAALLLEARAILQMKKERPDFKIYVIDGVKYTPEQLAFNLMNDAPQFGPVDEWRAFVEGGWEGVGVGVRVERDAGENFKLGLAYFQGTGDVVQDKVEGVRYFKKAAEQGLAEAQFNLSILYHTGDGVAQDRSEGLKWLIKAAEQGPAEAQHQLGMTYYKGENTHEQLAAAQDKAEAARWMRKSAEQGHAQAQTMLGIMYHRGEGVATDREEGIRWLRKAAAQGNKGGKDILAKLGESESEGADGVCRQS
jgi:hypothetical protein